MQGGQSVENIMVGLQTNQQRCQQVVRLNMFAGRTGSTDGLEVVCKIKQEAKDYFYCLF